MRKITQAELRSPVPIIAFVAPSGARAASAGFFLLQAADLAAMVPASNTGAATPIDMGGGNVGSDLRAKLIHDSEAQMRFLASGSGRNAAAAAQAVEPKSSACPRCPRSWTASEALQDHVIDLVAADLPALLAQTNGRVTVRKHLRLDLAGATVERHELPLQLRDPRRPARPQPDHAALPRRHPRHRLRAHAPGHRAAGPARHRGAAARAARALDRPVLVGRHRAPRLRHRVTRRSRRTVPAHGAFAAVGTLAVLLGGVLLFRVDNSPYGTTSFWLVLAIAGSLGLISMFVRDPRIWAGAPPAPARRRRDARRASSRPS